MIQPFDNNIVPWEQGVRLVGSEDMNKPVMYQNLIDFKSVLDSYNVSFVFIFGALLGLMREGDLISYDSDVDVACFNEFVRKDHWKMKQIKEDLRNKGFRVIDSDVCYLHNDFFIRNGEKIEIWWFDKIDNEWIFGDTVRYPASYFDKLEEINFIGTKFKIPSNPKEFVRLTYGDKWMTPNPKAKWLNLNPKEVKKRI